MTWCDVFPVAMFRTMSLLSFHILLPKLGGGDDWELAEHGEWHGWWGESAEWAARPDQQEGRVGQDQGEDGQRQGQRPAQVESELQFLLSSEIFSSLLFLAIQLLLNAQ